ncbi:hypothetical protein TREMEDRAFT_36150 [Tremella mesenterica DSM 1558]|uniref:uncharacterized protein n=1 Tax=Tremella mesenterica (strain ATCC 24925 / CBS 8224 / DSM 1558 / NBRC 9311 / NRRL Y-6157 / RJB 2259-6 / UBC 559-6) TaxID=578456 RepID=UPI00032D2027|nr:uncharacterized protein TREMEDRAFT_36150 [Tremella mesenterica DSM 1558]EIW65589.1 hypothetical protein TREMEDRAFT_36150 [Tremella mesenterica DSM 1558]
MIIGDETLKKKWRDFADLAGIGTTEGDRLKFSQAWLSSTKRRLNLRSRQLHGEAGSNDAVHVEAERARVQELLRGYDLNDIYNEDETGLCHAMTPDRGLSSTTRSGKKKKKTRIRYMFATNATGTDKREPLIIGKYQQPRGFGKRTAAELGFHYRNNGSAWMTAVLYEEWIRRWDQELCQINRHIILIHDNFKGLDVPEDLHCITVIRLSPNLTSAVRALDQGIIQPLDQGITRAFKAHHRAAFNARAIDRYDQGVTPSEVYDLNQLQAMISGTSMGRVITHDYLQLLG